MTNVIHGTSASEAVNGTSGDDSIIASGGNDTLTGGAGNDTLMAGASADAFVFAAAGTANGFDQIYSFVHGTDILQFTGADYGFSANHALTTAQLTVGTGAVGSATQFVWNPTSQTLYWDHDGAGGDAAVAIATFHGTVTVDASDFHFT